MGCPERAAPKSAGWGPPARSALLQRVSGRPASGSAQGHPGSDAAGGEAVRVTCGPGRTPPSALGLLRPFPHAPCPARDSAGQQRRPGASGLEAKRPGYPPQHVSVRPCRSRFVPNGPSWGPRWGLAPPLEGWGGGVGVPALPAASTLSPGGRTSSSPAPPPALGKVKLSRWRSFPLPSYALSLPPPVLESEASAEGDQWPRVSPSWCSKVTRAKRTHPLAHPGAAASLTPEVAAPHSPAWTEI